MTVLEFPQKDGSPPPMEPHDFEYQHGTSSVRMPNGSWMCIKQTAAAHATPEQADRFLHLQIVMTLLWNDERKKAQGE